MNFFFPHHLRGHNSHIGRCCASQRPQGGAARAQQILMTWRASPSRPREPPEVGQWASRRGSWQVPRLRVPLRSSALSVWPSRHTGRRGARTESTAEDLDPGAPGRRPGEPLGSRLAVMVGLTANTQGNSTHKNRRTPQDPPAWVGGETRHHQNVVDDALCAVTGPPVLDRP